MNKSEFLEILRDYLKKDFLEDEINDILRDYEEYFIDGKIEGKSDIEIIESLGSPKMIANELISQIDMSKKGKYESNKNKLNDSYNVVKIRAKEGFNKTKNIISDKLTPDIDSKNHNQSRKIIKIVLFLLSLILVIPAFTIGLVLIGIGISLIATLAIFLGTIPFMYNFLKATPDVLGLYVFMSVAFIGGQILAWQLYTFILKVSKSVIKKYTSWLKTRNLYINASKKKEKYEKEYTESEHDDDYYDERGDEENE